MSFYSHVGGPLLTLKKVEEDGTLHVEKAELKRFYDAVVAQVAQQERERIVEEIGKAQRNYAQSDEAQAALKDVLYALTAPTEKEK